MTQNEAKNEYNRLKILQDKLFRIRGEDSDLFYAELKGKISVLLDIYNNNKQVYTMHIEKFIKENK